MSDTSSPESVGKREPPPCLPACLTPQPRGGVAALRVCFAAVSPSKGDLEEIVGFKADRKMIVTDAGRCVSLVSMKIRLLKKTNMIDFK